MVHCTGWLADRMGVFLSCLTCVRISELYICFYFILGIVRQRRVARFSQKAANRWLLAVMLLRNPSLRSYRRQGRVTSLLDMRSNRINSTVIIRI